MGKNVFKRLSAPPTSAAAANQAQALPRCRSRNQNKQESSFETWRNKCDKMPWNIALSSACALGLYLNAIPADFAYDDSRAIVRNPDVTGETSMVKLWSHDFWGTPITHSGSHKSYRPLCILSFRLDHLLFGLNPTAFHTTNVVLHVMVTALFTWIIQNLVNCSTEAVSHDRKSPIRDKRSTNHDHCSSNHDQNTAVHENRIQTVPLLAGLLFASHPIHTEAVSGVVGRAEILCALFFLLALITYEKYCKLRDDYSPQRWLWLIWTCLLAACALLCKEHGLMCLTVCAVYDFVMCSRLQVTSPWKQSQEQVKKLVEGVLCLAVMFLGLFSLRVYLMGWTAPDFAPADNPAADSKSLLERTLTFLYLPFFNFWLLLYPYTLSFDWSMEAVPLVSSLADVRNLCTLTFYSVLIFGAYKVATHLNVSSHKPSSYNSHKKNSSSRHEVFTNTSSNYFITKISNGYSNGHLANGHVNGHSNGHSNGHANGGLRPRISSSSSYKSSSESDASSTSSLHFRNGHVTSRKSRSRTPSVDSQAEGEGRTTVSQLAAFSLAVLVLPFLPATNLLFYVGFVIAERILYIPSMGFAVIVALGIQQVLTKYRNKQVIYGLCSVLIMLFGVRTVVRNWDWRDEFSLYHSGVGVNPPKAWGNLGNIYSAKGKVKEAEQAYQKALFYRSNMADVHYNLGILLQDQKRYSEAVHSYRTAIQCRPKLTMAHLNLGIVLTALDQKSEAEKVYRTCANLDISGLKDPRLHEQTKISALYNLGRLLADQERYQEAVQIYQEAITRKPSHYSPQSLYNMLGEAYFKLEKLEEAEHYYREALAVKPDHIPAHLTMSRLAHYKNDLKEAEQWLGKALQLKPKDATVFQHYGQLLADTGRFKEAARMYQSAVQLNPSDFELTFNLANTLRQAELNEEAEAYYGKAVQLRPSDALAHMNLGAMQHTNGKLIEAEKSYLSAIKLRPGDTITQANLAKLRAIKGRS